MSLKKFLPYGKQSLDAEDKKAVLQALDHDMITRGPQTKAFEQEVAALCNARWAVAFSSGTSALYAAFQAASISSQDRIFTTPNTFIATAAAALRLGARPFFIDIERNSGNLDLAQLEKELNQPLSRGRHVIVPVHFAGIAQNIVYIDRMLKSPDDVIIEDAAHAIGSFYPDGSTKVGSCKWSAMTVFSFHPVKTITSGEGGMVTTNDESLYHRLACIRNSGIIHEKPILEQQDAPWYYEVQEISANYHMTEMQAALGRSQLKKINQFVEKRRNLVKSYRKQLSHLEHIRLFDEAHDDKSAYHLMVVQVDFQALNTTRTKVMNALKEEGIGSQYHYIPLYRSPVFTKLYGDQSEAFPEMEAYYAQALSLPLFYEMDEEDVERVCLTLKKTLSP